jgi:hypothetical protein
MQRSVLFTGQFQSFVLRYSSIRPVFPGFQDNYRGEIPKRTQKEGTQARWSQKFNWANYISDLTFFQILTPFLWKWGQKQDTIIFLEAP